MLFDRVKRVILDSIAFALLFSDCQIQKRREKTLHLFKYSNANLTLITLFYFPEPQSTKTLRSCLNYVSQDKYKKKKNLKAEWKYLCYVTRLRTFLFKELCDAMPCVKTFPLECTPVRLIREKYLGKCLCIFIYLLIRMTSIYVQSMYIYLYIYIYITCIFNLLNTLPRKCHLLYI